MPAHDLVALPGDNDLDLNISDATLNEVVHLGHEFIITFHADNGCWRSGDGSDALVDVHSINGEMRFGFPTLPAEELDRYRTVLDDWAIRKVRLRIAAAPGRLTSLLASDGTALAVPRIPAA